MALRPHPYPNSTDVQLWQQVKDGSELAFGKLLTRYFNPLQNYGYKFVQNEAFVKDCVQEVFIDIWNRPRPHQYARQRAGVPAKLRSETGYSGRVSAAHFERRRVGKPGNEGSSVEFSPEWSLIEQESLAETTLRIADALNKLPKRQREVIYLRFYQNLERDEIAVIMDVHPQSVSNLMQVAFRSFRENWVGLLLLTTLVGLSFSD